MNRFVKVPLYIGILFIVGMIAGHLTFKILSMSNTVEVPDLKGKSVAEAVNLLQRTGLHLLGAAEDYDTDVPAGAIMRQDIPATSKVKEGRGIKVVVSRGPRVQYVPDVVGMKLDEAEAVLEGRSIRISKVINVHSDVDKNIIIAQRPESDEKGGENFRVIVSLGSFEEDKK
ncbi:MAG TPA: PASTA domain-containing protein [Dissulfurispiraceae bacterium]|nr:PASTA domain-containing protein [Dissulfurispiraceae bacterium]